MNIKTICLLTFYYLTIVSNPDEGFWIRHKETQQMKWAPLKNHANLRDLTIYLLATQSQHDEKLSPYIMRKVYPYARPAGWEIVKKHEK